jgi:hypothetical protein
MPRRGTFYAITNEEADQLLSLVGNDLELARQALELWTIERQRKRFIAPVDHAWDVLHRCLTDGTLSGIGKGATPLARCILGGKSLHGGKDYIICYVTQEQAAEIALALDEIEPGWLLKRYANLPAAGYIGRIEDEDFQYTWDYFTSVRNLYSKAVAEGRGVVFVTDQ